MEFSTEDIRIMKKHAKGRAKWRYKLKLTDEKHDELVQMIKNGQVQVLHIQEDGKMLCLVDNYYLIYHVGAECIVTFLAPWMYQCIKYTKILERDRSQYSVGVNNGYWNSTKNNW